MSDPVSFATDHRMYILGAHSPAMSAVERLLRECNQLHGIALWFGSRVTPHNAYKATSVYGDATSDTTSLVAVNCGDGDAFPFDFPVVKTLSSGDTHSTHPELNFMRDSVIGQTIIELAEAGRLPASWEALDSAVEQFDHASLTYQNPDDATTLSDGHSGYYVSARTSPTSSDSVNLRIPAKYVVAAASEHCLSHAYDPNHSCLGLPERPTFLRLRNEQLAHFVASIAPAHGRDPDYIDAAVARAAMCIRNTNYRVPGLPGIPDMRGYFDPKYPRNSAVANVIVAEASAVTGTPCMTQVSADDATPTSTDVTLHYGRDPSGLAALWNTWVVSRGGDLVNHGYGVPAFCNTAHFGYVGSRQSPEWTDMNLPSARIPFFPAPTAEMRHPEYGPPYEAVVQTGDGPAGPLHRAIVNSRDLTMVVASPCQSYKEALSGAFQYIHDIGAQRIVPTLEPPNDADDPISDNPDQFDSFSAPSM